jgi:hypothetical protein
MDAMSRTVVAPSSERYLRTSSTLGVVGVAGWQTGSTVMADPSRSVSRAAVVAGLAGVAAMAAPASAGATTGTFTVTPSTNLKDGQSVTVSWSNQPVTGVTQEWVLECSPTGFNSSQVTDANSEWPTPNCSKLFVQTPVSSNSVSTVIHGTAGPQATQYTCGSTPPTDCVVQLVLQPAGSVNASVPVSFAPRTK